MRVFMGTHFHHIIPRHAGGTDDPENLIELTIEEHAEAHHILFETNGQWQDFIAWKSLSGQIGKDDIRREMTRLAWTGRKHTEETKRKIREARAKQITTEETKQKMSSSRKGRVFPHMKLPCSPESNLKRSATLKGRPTPEYICPHCGKEGKSSAMKRWHFDKCKEKPA